METPFGPGNIPLARAHTASRTWLDRGSHGSTFTLEAGQTCHLPVLVRMDERPIYWLPISAVGGTGESPNR